MDTEILYITNIVFSEPAGREGAGAGQLPLAKTWSALSRTRRIVATARTPCPMTTGSGKWRSGGTGILPLLAPPAPAGTATADGVLCVRYTPTQRAAMVRPRRVTTTSTATATQASLKVSVIT